MTTTSTVVEVEGCNGEWFNLTTGDRGVYLDEDPKGIFYDPPVKVVYEEPGNYPGARYLGHRILRRDITFGAVILNDKNDPWSRRDSDWRKAWAFDKDTIIHVTTDGSGRRSLKLRLGESPEMVMITDPNGLTLNVCPMVCIAGDPFWYEEDVTYEAFTETDTRFDPNPLPWPFPQHSLPKETVLIEVDPKDGKGGLNPTDQEIFLKWLVPGSSEAPALPYIPWLPWLGAPNSPQTIWTVPDYSFEDPQYANRRVQMPGLLGGLETPDIQVISITGSPTSGTFRVGIPWENGTDWSGQIARNASLTTVKTVLENMPTIPVGSLAVEKGTDTWQVTFGGDLMGVDVPQMIGDESLLVGGTFPYVSVSTRAEGRTAPAEDAVIDTDPRVEQVSSKSGSQLWARMNGVRFRNVVPAYTKSKTFELTVSGARQGEMVTLRIPRPWSRPWGLE